MTLRVPSLVATGCIHLTVCGSLQTDDPALLATLSKRRTLIFRIGSGDDSRHVRVWLGGGSGRHCHIDVAAPSYFADRKLPETDRSEEQLQQALAPFAGQTMEYSVEGTFEVAFAEVPAVIGTFRALKVDQGGVCVQLTSGALSVSGAPVQRIEWEDDEPRQTTEITLQAEGDSEFKASYLVDAFETVKVAFDEFMRGGFPSAHG